MDINLVRHAKDYIDCLAKGINPFTKEEINENDIVNNVKISRCLFYVSDVLNEVINNNGINNSVKQNRCSFSTDAIDLSKIVLSPLPITISVIVQNINALKPTEMDKLKVTAITNWLVDINLLQIIQINGKNYKRPTAEGLAMGISEEEREGQNGTYHYVLYSESAQQFIIDNLNSIIDGGYNGSSKTNAGKAWADDEDFMLKTMFEEGADIQNIAVTLKRSNNAIKLRLEKLGLVK